jgi:hypothetical protein
LFQGKTVQCFCTVFFIFTNIFCCVTKNKFKVADIADSFFNGVGSITAQNNRLCHKLTEGTEFWFGFMENRIYKAEFHAVLVTVSSHQNTKFKIVVGPPNAPLYNREFTISTNSTQTAGYGDLFMII